MPASRDITRTTLAVLFIGMLIAACFWVVRPFLMATIWASMIVTATWPVMTAIQARLGGRRGPAVAVMTVMLLLIVIVPFGLAVATIVDTSADMGAAIRALATLQAVLGGIVLALVGVPAVALLTAVMLILCLAQVGPTPVLLPAVIWLYWRDGALRGTVLLVISIVVAALDNFVRPALIKKGVDMPLLMVFAGVIGGLMAFGIVGIFVGPVVLVVSFTLLKAWIASAEPTDGETAVTP